MLRPRALLLAGGLQAAALGACAAPPRSQAPAQSQAQADGAPSGAGAAEPHAGRGLGNLQIPVRARRPAPTLSLPDFDDASLPLASLTLELTTVAQDGASRARRTVTRTTALIHVKPHDSQTEWLFVRNSVDGRRVSASRIDHHRRVIIEYSESELRTAEIAQGWADVAYLGVNIANLRRWSPTGRHERLGDFQFEEYLPTAGHGSGSTIWWSRSASVPLRILRGGAQLQLSLEKVRPSIDAALLRDPRLRFPSYSVMDVADFREEHHAR